MIELQANEFYTVIPLFEHINHNAALVYAVLERNSPGRVFADRRDTPSSAFLFLQDAFYYVGGSAANEAFSRELVTLLFDDLLSHATDKELVLFAFSEAWQAKLAALLGPHRAILIQRKIFAFNADKFKSSAAWREPVPPNLRLVPINAQLAQAHPHLKPLVGPTSKRFGVCLIDGDEILSTCQAVCVGRGEVEIDIHTPEKHRRKGYATLTACAFIQESLDRGLTPNWSCWPERNASCTLARKLGFEDRPSVFAHYWAEGT